MFHLTHRGEPRVCRATIAACPYGNATDHYSSEDEARQSFEASHQTFTPHTRAAPVSVEEASLLYSSLTGDGSRVQFMRCALEAYELFGTEEVEVFATRDRNGVVLAAASLILRQDDDLPLHYILDYLGARGGGAGSQMVETLRQRSRETGIPIYLETTADSETFWVSKMRVVPDEDLGLEGYLLPT